MKQALDSINFIIDLINRRNSYYDFSYLYVTLGSIHE